MPISIVVLALAHFMYGMPAPDRPLSLFSLVSLGVLAFRALGLILASVVNSTQESQLLIQLLYMPMLFLSGATFPVSILPPWAQIVSQYLPASYLVTGLQGIFLRHQSLVENWPSGVAMLVTVALATFISSQIFRWEKEEKIRTRAKLWVLAALCPFIFLGTYQIYSQDHLRKTQILFRDLERSHTLLIRGGRLFVGDGRIIDPGAVLVKSGKVEEVYEKSVPDAGSLNAEVIEAAGQTVLPGFIDVHVHLGAPGGFYESAEDYKPEKVMTRALAAYLYSGVTTVKSAGDALDETLKLRSRIASGEHLGATLFACGPVFTTEGGHGTEYFEELPGVIRDMARQQWVRLPRTAEEARRQVRDLKAAGVDGIKGILDSGSPGMPFERMDESLLRAVTEEARAQNLPTVIHTGDSRDITDALQMGVDGIEHGSFRDKIPDEPLLRMARDGVTYDPTLSVIEAYAQLLSGKDDLLDRSLVQQVGPPRLLQGTRKVFHSKKFAELSQGLKDFRPDLAQGKENLLRAYRDGVILVTGSDAGNPLVFHGPTVHRELQLWVEAGIPPGVALQAATYNAARLLRAEDHIGLIKKGHDADLLLVDGDPLKDISATERVSMVIYKGERLNRPRLLEP
jgi:enamidase